MRSFRWKLQRLLDVTIQRELLLRSKLLEISHNLAGVRQEIVRRMAIQRAALRRIARQEITERIRRQEMFLRYAEAEEKRIDALRERIREIESRLVETREKLLKVKSSRETLERLGEEARKSYVKEQLRRERKRLDEIANGAFARKVIAARTSGAA